MDQAWTAGPKLWGQDGKLNGEPRQRMELINIKFTHGELELLATLASDQLFRREFVEPRIPGRTPSLGEIKRGKVLVVRMRSLLEQGSTRRKPAATKAKRDAV